MLLLVWLLAAAVSGARAGEFVPECQALMNAASEGDIKALKTLLTDENTDVNCVSEVGETPLHVAGIWGKLEVVQLLLAAGANVNAQATGEKSLKMAPLHWFVHPGYTESVAALIEAGADVDMVVRNEQGEHITALDIVERFGEDSERHAGTLALLRKAGARHAAEVESGEAKADL